MDYPCFVDMLASFFAFSAAYCFSFLLCSSLFAVFCELTFLFYSNTFANQCSWLLARPQVRLRFRRQYKPLNVSACRTVSSALYYHLVTHLTLMAPLCI